MLSLVAITNLPKDPKLLHRRFTDVDICSRFVRENGKIVFNFGKYLGQPLHAVAIEDPGYLEWMLSSGFLDDVKAIVERAKQRV